MKTVVGMFGTRAAADRAARDLVIAGLPPGNVRQLTPGSSEREVHSAIPTAETEYEEALRRSRSVVFLFASNNRQKEIARRLLDRAGAESLDAGDEDWRVGLSPAEVHRRPAGRRAS